MNTKGEHFQLSRVASFPVRSGCVGVVINNGIVLSGVESDTLTGSREERCDDTHSRPGMKSVGLKRAFPESVRNSLLSDANEKGGRTGAGRFGLDGKRDLVLQRWSPAAAAEVCRPVIPIIESLLCGAALGFKRLMLRRKTRRTSFVLPPTYKHPSDGPICLDFIPIKSI